MALSLPDDCNRLSHSPEVPITSTNQDWSAASGLNSHATTLVDEYLAKGGSLEQFEQLIIQHVDLAQEITGLLRERRRDEAAPLVRRLWRATGVSVLMMEPVLNEIRRRRLHEGPGNVDREQNNP
jgi:hypothetical protein